MLVFLNFGFKFWIDFPQFRLRLVRIGEMSLPQLRRRPAQDGDRSSRTFQLAARGRKRDHRGRTWRLGTRSEQQRRRKSSRSQIDVFDRSQGKSFFWVFWDLKINRQIKYFVVLCIIILGIRNCFPQKINLVSLTRNFLVSCFYS